MRYSRTGLVTPTSIGNCVQYRTISHAHNITCQKINGACGNCAAVNLGQGLRTDQRHEIIWRIAKSTVHYINLKLFDKFNPEAHLAPNVCTDNGKRVYVHT